MRATRAAPIKFALFVFNITLREQEFRWEHQYDLGMTDKQDKGIKKIALIDDDETCHMIFGVIIRRLNPDIQIEAFSSALDAYRLIATNCFDACAIILDVNMPRMTGWQFLEELKVINYEIPVYMLTSSDDPRDRKRAEEFANVRRYLIKPLRTDQLQEIIDENLY